MRPGTGHVTTTVSPSLSVRADDLHPARFCVSEHGPLRQRVAYLIDHIQKTPFFLKEEQLLMYLQQRR